MKALSMRNSAFTIASIATMLVSACGNSAVQPEPVAQTQQSEAPLAIAAQDASLQWGGCPEIFPAGCEIAVLHGDPSQPNADVFLRVPAGYVIPPHSHTSAERMILVSGEMNVQYQGAASTMLSEGEYAYGPAGLPHLAACIASDEACVLFIAFEGPVDATAFEGAIE